MAKQVRSQATRAAIVRGAAETFDRFGYGGSSLSDVIAQAGVTKGALYFHFNSKEELAAAVMDEQHTLSVNAATTMNRQNLPGLESVIKLSHTFAHQLITEPVVRAGVRLTLEGSFGDPNADPYRDWVETIAQLLHRAIDEKDVRTDLNSEDLARFIVSTFTGVQLVSQVFSGHSDLQRRVEQMWDVLLPALVLPRKLPYFRSIAAEGRPGSQSV